MDDAELVTEHSISLTDLTPEMEYHFQVTSDDGVNGPVSSGDLTFTASAVLIITDVQATAMSTTEAIVTWTTNDAADSSVAYGLTAEYELGSVDDAELVTEHSIGLVDLIPGTEYHFQVTSDDGVNEPVASADLTFTTPAVLLISDVQATVLSATEVLVSWNTDRPADSAVDFGLTAEHEVGSVTDDELLTWHELTLTDLVPDTVYHFQVTSVDELGVSASSADATFDTTVSNIVSDDFSSCTLDTDLWTLVDPVGDATIELAGPYSGHGWLSMSVPDGVDHDAWVPVNRAARVMQSVNNADFEVEVKFESELGLQYQDQGIIVEQDPTNFVRFDFYSTNSNTHVFAATVINATVVHTANSVMSGSGDLYLRVKREGDTWTQSYSDDGVDWTTVAIFDRSLTVTAIGPYVASAIGSSSPGHTAHVDYFFNTADPVIPEDGSTNALPGDYNNDCAVDLDDLALFVPCLNGPEQPAPADGCMPAQFDAADFELDLDVDILDYAVLQLEVGVW